MKRIYILIMVMVCFSFLAAVAGCGGKAEKPSTPQPKQAGEVIAEAAQEPVLLSDLTKAKKGKITIRQTGQSSESGSRTVASDDFNGWRVCSPFDSSPNDVVAGKQFAFGGKDGLAISVHQSLWTKIVNWFKKVLIIGGIAIGAVFVVLGFTTGWANAGATILRLFASIVPFIGSLVEKIFGDKKNATTKAALVQTVQGVQAYKVANPEQKAALNTELAKAQDTTAKAIIKDVKAGG